MTAMDAAMMLLRGNTVLVQRYSGVLQQQYRIGAAATAMAGTMSVVD